MKQSSALSIALDILVGIYAALWYAVMFLFGKLPEVDEEVGP